MKEVKGYPNLLRESRKSANGAPYISMGRSPMKDREKKTEG